MITDKYEGWSTEKLKTLHTASNSLGEMARGAEVNLTLVEGEPSLTYKTVRKTMKYGNHVHHYDHTEADLRLQEDWYTKLYLNGIGTVTYNNFESIVLDAREINVNRARPDLQLPEMKLYKVTLPVRKTREIEVQGYQGHTFKRKEYYVEVEKRFMAVIPTSDGSLNFAGQSENRAAATLKKQMMQYMKKQMGL